MVCGAHPSQYALVSRDNVQQNPEHDKAASKDQEEEKEGAGTVEEFNSKGASYTSSGSEGKSRVRFFRERPLATHLTKTGSLVSDVTVGPEASVGVLSVVVEPLLRPITV